MPHPSPFDLIQKASRRATAADRWAALKVNTQQRVPLTKTPQAAAPQELPPQEEPVGAGVQQPPFPPPQPRHPYVDEVVQRHEQARKNAMPRQQWTPKAAQGLTQTMSKPPEPPKNPPAPDAP